MKLRVMMSKELPGFLPERAHADDAGFDVRASEAATVYPGTKAVIRCGIHIEVEPGFEVQVRSRSGLAKKNSVFVINSPGTIDAGYRGEVMVMLHNLGATAFAVDRGDRVAQLVVNQLPAVSVELVEKLSGSSRGEAGFGSTGVK